MGTTLGSLFTQASRAVALFDDAVERRIDRWRGRPGLDRMMYAASELGDFSLIWHLVGTARALAPDRAPVHAVRVAAILGAESLLVNQGVKRLVGRHRPPWEHERPHRLRQPTTSSFPSGHASAAAVAVAVLSENDPLWPLYAALGVTVAVSRVYAKVHHPSDVVAGALIGLAIGAVARRLWPFPA
ncbi:MAG: phosphatase PAP2 family protein [Acidimicrobiales bacterium]